MVPLMAARKQPQQLKTGPALWGPTRARLGISLRTLEAATGIVRGDLSKMEHGRLFPTGKEYESVTEALAKLEGGTNG